MGKWQGKVKFGLRESQSSGKALQGQRMLGGDSSSLCPSGCRAPAWPLTRHPIVLFNTSGPNCKKLGNSLQSLQIQGVQLLQSATPMDTRGRGSLGPAPFLPKSSFSSWKKQEDKMEKRDWDHRSRKGTRDRGKASHRADVAAKFWQMGTRRLFFI